MPRVNFAGDSPCALLFAIAEDTQRYSGENPRSNVLCYQGHLELYEILHQLTVELWVHVLVGLCTNLIHN